MGSKTKEEEFSPNDFFDIVKKAYDRGVNEQGITVERLIEDLKIDLMKMKVQ